MSESKYNANYQYYLAQEERYKKLAEEMRQKRMEVLTEWKQSKHKGDNDGKQK